MKHTELSLMSAIIEYQTALERYEGYLDNVSIEDWDAVEDQIAYLKRCIAKCDKQLRKIRGL